jgi:chromosome segregation and condensation protein ScpB
MEEIMKQINELVRTIKTVTSMSEAPVKVRRLARIMNIKESSGSCPTTRKLIREAIKAGHAIGSNNSGYFMIETEKEMQRYLNSLMRRQIKMSQRIDDVYHAFYGRK